MKQRMNRIYHKPKKPAYVTVIAQRLRANSTTAESVLWEMLRDRKFLGLKFKRQKPIGRYVADFYCAEKGLIIELDGGSHEGKEQYDATRDEIMRACKLKVIRFQNEKVLADPDGVLKEDRD